MNFAEQVARLQALVDDAKAEYGIAKEKFERVSELVKEIGVRDSQCGMNVFEDAQKAYEERHEAFENYMRALKRYNDFILRAKEPKAGELNRRQG